MIDYDDIRKAKSYKQIVLTAVKRAELTVPQLVDMATPVVYPLVNNIMRFSFEDRSTTSQMDAEFKKQQRIASIVGSASAVPPASNVLYDGGLVGPASVRPPSMQQHVGSASADPDATVEADPDPRELQGK